jgi:signal transduction histidine kinase
MLPHRNSRFEGVFLLRKLVEEVVESLAARSADQAIDVVIDVPPDQIIAAERKLFRRAVENLVQAAVEAMPHGGSLVATSICGPEAIELEIADTGPALTDKQRRDVFELLPAAPRGGTGWGLAVVRRIAEMHGGSVTAANCPEGGVAFTLRIPRPSVLEAAA